MIFTFDDGPSEWTPAILDLLAEHEQQAWFFVIGQRANERPDLLRRIAVEGHWIGNHTYSHPALAACSLQEAKRELATCEGAILLAAGKTSRMWRAPFLAPGESGAAAAAALGLQHMSADVIPNDCWLDDPEEIARIVLAEAGPESLVCLHDGIPPDGGSERCTASRQPTVEALRIILEAL